MNLVKSNHVNQMNNSAGNQAVTRHASLLSFSNACQVWEAAAAAEGRERKAGSGTRMWGGEGRQGGCLEVEHGRFKGWWRRRLSGRKIGCHPAV